MPSLVQKFSSDMYNLHRASERRTTLPPDEAVLPLVVRRGETLARTIMQPSSPLNESQTGSDSDYEPNAASATQSERGSIAITGISSCDISIPPFSCDGLEGLGMESNSSGTATSKYMNLFGDLLTHVLAVALDITDGQEPFPRLSLFSRSVTPDINDGHGALPGHSLFSRSVTPDINDGSGGLLCFADEEASTGAIVCPPQTSDVFQGLLIVASEMGFMYGSPEREGHASLFNNIAQRPTTPPITPTSQAVIPLPFTFPSTGNEAAFRPPFFTLPSTDSLDAALLVSVCLKHGGHKHCVLRAPLPNSVLRTYRCLVQSREAAVSSIAALLQTLDDNEVQLATSRKPILMDETKTHENPMAGYVELGCLAALDRSVEFKPAVDCDERWQLIEMQDITIGTPIYVLYIWSSENEGTLPVLWGPGALHNPNGDIAAQANAAVLLIESPYIALFNELIINAPTAKSTFTLIIFVCIVIEACRTLQVKCARRTGLFTVSGRHQLNAANVVLAFRRQDNTAYLQPKTFHNHRGWFFRAETLYETLLQAYPHHSQMSDQLIKERTMMDWLGDLLQTPLSEARQLRPFVYGTMSDFLKKLETLEQRNNISRKVGGQKTGEGSRSRRGGGRGSPEQSGDESLEN
ncbi:hypothetical protein JOM56_005849 [Amanita muscaria]